MTTFPRSLARAPAFTAVRDGLMWLLDPNAGLRLRAKLAYAIGRATIAIAESPDDFRGLRAKRMTQPGLCIEAVNRGRAAVTLMEVGLTRGETGRRSRCASRSSTTTARGRAHWSRARRWCATSARASPVIRCCAKCAAHMR